MKNSLQSTLDAFADALHEPRIPPVEYVTSYPRKIDLRWLTPEDRARVEQEEKMERLGV